MTDELFAWLTAVLGPTWGLVDGGLPNTTLFDKGHYCIVRCTGGPAVDVDDRKPRYKLTLIGPKNDRAAKDTVRAASNTLVDAVIAGTEPCGVAGVRMLGEPVGPSYTSDDRAWMTLDLQLTF